MPKGNIIWVKKRGGKDEKRANINRNVKPITAQNTQIKAKFGLLYGYLHSYDSEHKGKHHFTHPFKAVTCF